MSFRTLCWSTSRIVTGLPGARTGPGVWPAVFAGASLASLPISASPVWALVTAGGNTLAPLAAAALLDRIGFRRELDRLRDALAIVVAALFGMTVSATVGTAAFGSGSLVLRMLTLQAFNTGIALCSFVFAAAITERMQIRRALEAAATGLERRVAERTADLSNANARLEAEIAERERVQEELRSSERLL